MRTDGRTDKRTQRHDEAKSRFSQFCEKRPATTEHLTQDGPTLAKILNPIFPNKNECQATKRGSRQVQLNAKSVPMHATKPHGGLSV